MGKTIIFGNQKGGVAKTTTTYNIATQLAQKGYKVLMIDSDPQASLTIITGLDPRQYVGGNLVALLYDEEGKIDVHKCIYKVPYFNNTKNAGSLSIIPSEIELANGDMEFVARKGNDRLISRVIKKINDEYDFICIDCPPSLGIISVNDIAASDYIVGCVEPGWQSYRGIQFYIQSITNAIRNCEYDTEFLGLIISKVKNDNDCKDMVELFNADYNVLGVIPASVEVPRGEFDGVPISQRKPAHIASLEFSRVADKIIEKTNKGA